MIDLANPWEWVTYARGLVVTAVPYLLGVLLIGGGFAFVVRSLRRGVR